MATRDGDGRETLVMLAIVAEDAVLRLDFIGGVWAKGGRDNTCAFECLCEDG